jgi:phosphonate degradation associated HDIG domain protein
MPTDSAGFPPRLIDVASVIKTVFDLFRRRGGSLYGGEAVTQLEHALQAAHMAERAGAEPALVTAALLHDVGHLLHDLPADAPDKGIDDVHEKLGDAWLRRHFVPAVCDPVRLHVAAKRYLCAVEPVYLASLSEPSRLSLQLQGGPFAEAEAREFEREPFFRESVALRRWDDLAKVAGLPTPDLGHFLEYGPYCLTSDSPVGATS